MIPFCVDGHSGIASLGHNRRKHGLTHLFSVARENGPGERKINRCRCTLVRIMPGEGKKVTFS